MSGMACAPHLGRVLLEVTGEDRVSFLQGLVTQDMKRVEAQGIGYGAMLTPQGKLITDFFLVEQEAAVLIDLPAETADDLERRLSMFKLRSKVQIARIEMDVTRGLGAAPETAVQDPRHEGLGWRLYGDAVSAGDPIEWDKLHIELRVPQLGLDLLPNDSFILEFGFERLNGVDFRKGCYVGQEVTARMHHKTDLRRGVKRIELSKPSATGTELFDSSERLAGRVGACVENSALALLRLDRLDGLHTVDGGSAEVLTD